MSRGALLSTVWDHVGRCASALVHDLAVDTIGGYQLIRRLGSGSRAEVYLGHAGPELDAAGRRNAAIKLFRSDLGRESIDDEIESLTLAASAREPSRHLLSLRDIATGADGRPCLIFPRLLPTTLARLLAERERLEPGEAVTVLAPLSAAIGDLHAAGVVHGGIRPGAVLFDDVGAPVLACFGRSSRIRSAPGGSPGSGQHRSPAYSVPVEGVTTPSGPLRATPAQLAEDPRVADDLRGLVSIAVSVLARVPAAHALGAGLELLAWLESDEPVLLADRMTSEFSDRLFDLADGVPIDLTELDDAAQERSVQSVVFAGLVSRPLVSQLAISTSDDGVSNAKVGRGLLLRVAARAGVAVRQIRRPFWIVGALGLAAVLSAVAVFPSTATTATTGVDPGERTASSAGPSHPPTPSGHGQPTDSAEKESDKSIAGEDPVAAAIALLEARDRCMSTLSVLCLDGVDQAASAALDADRQVIRSLQEKGTATRERSLAGATVELSQRLGDSALMTITPRTDPATASPATDGPATNGPVENKSEPTSLLLIRSEVGWRIRDLFRS
jgi:hypothetical protein